MNAFKQKHSEVWGNKRIKCNNALYDSVLGMKVQAVGVEGMTTYYRK